MNTKFLKQQAAQHTPGPWTYQCVNAGEIGSKDKVTVEASDGHIATVRRVMQENGRDTFGRPVNVRRNLPEVKANARLIAAAPDLLEAANRIMNMLAEDFPCECAKPGNENSIYDPGETCPPCAMRDAIAKAEGK